jgi:hypothetical protein
MDGRTASTHSRARYEKAVEAARRLGVDLPDAGASLPSVSDLRRQARARLDDQLNAAGAKSAPLPAVTHDPVVMRALERRPPFDADGKDGYRDSLLWESVLELAAGDQVVLVSRDVRAFFEGSKDGGLHRALEAEAEERCGREAAVVLFFDLDAALDFTIEKTAAEQARAAQADADRRAKRMLKDLLRTPEFQASIADEMRYASGWEDMSWDDVRALLPHRTTYDIVLDEVEDVADIQVVDARCLTDEVIATLVARLLVSVEVHLPASEAAAIDEDDALVFGRGNDPADLLKASALRTVRGEFEAGFDPSDWGLRRIRLRRFKRSRR